MSQAVISESNLTPLIQIITWFMLVTAVFAILLRAVSKTLIVRSLSVDDVLVLIAFAFAAAQSTAILVSARDGLGKPRSLLSSDQVSNVAKAQYASSMLYVISVCFAKLSVIYMIGRITPNKTDLRLVWGLGLAVVAWAFTAFWVLAFQCHTPPWDVHSGTCIDRTAFWNYFEIINLLTDAALIALPAAIISRIQTRILRKVRIIFFFALRIAPMAAMVIKLIYWNRIQSRHTENTDETLNMWPVVLSTEIVQGLEIFSTCCLNLRPFLEGLQTGFMHADDFRRRGQSVKPTHTDRVLNSFKSKTANGKTSKSYNSISVDECGRHGMTFVPHTCGDGHRVSIKGGKRNNREWDTNSQHSRSQIIKETRTFAVDRDSLAVAPSSRSDVASTTTATGS